MAAGEDTAAGLRKAARRVFWEASQIDKARNLARRDALIEAATLVRALCEEESQGALLFLSTYSGIQVTATDTPAERLDKLRSRHDHAHGATEAIAALTAASRMIAHLCDPTTPTANYVQIGEGWIDDPAWGDFWCRYRAELAAALDDAAKEPV